MRSATTRRAAVLAASLMAGSALFVLAGCGTDSSSPESSNAVSSTTESVAMTDAWVKAVSGDEEMTAAFGVLTNASSDEVTLVSASTSAAGMVELHEVVMEDGSMVMQPKEGGIVVPADGSATLEPGGDHIMLMELDGAIEPGEVVTFELAFDDGSSVTVDATAKEFSGADEDYDGGQSMDEG
jgi:periplasmic copper chaperone A